MFSSFVLQYIGYILHKNKSGNRKKVRRNRLNSGKGNNVLVTPTIFTSNFQVENGYLSDSISYKSL